MTSEIDPKNFRYFKEQLFSVFHRVFCKIANVSDIDLKFSGSISDFNIDDPAKFREVGMPKSCISRNWVFSGFWSAIHSPKLF